MPKQDVASTYRLRVCNWLTEAARDADHKTHAWWRARVHENGTGDHAQRVRDFVQVLLCSLSQQLGKHTARERSNPMHLTLNMLPCKAMLLKFFATCAVNSC